MPLSIQHQADSAGDKAVSLIADNSGSNVAAAFKGVNKATQNGDTVADLVVSLDGEAIATGATDDAAAAGAIFPLAALYTVIGSVDEIDSGDVGRLRATARRVLMNAADQRVIDAGKSSGVSRIGDVEVSTNASKLAGYGAATTAFFDGTDVGFGASVRWVRIPFTNWRDVTIRVYHSLGVNLTVDVYAQLQGAIALSPDLSNSLLATAVVVTGGTVTFTSRTKGSTAGSGIIDLPALPCDYLILGLTPASDPAAGQVQLAVSRRT